MNIETYEIALSVIDKVNSGLTKRPGINRMGKRVHKLREVEANKIITMVCSHNQSIHSIDVIWSQLANYYFYLVICFKEDLDNVLTDFVYLEVDD